MDDQQHPEEQSFRDLVSTADAKGRRLWVYARRPKGRFTTVRGLLSLLQIGLLLAAPFIKVGGQSLILLDIVNRHFVIFGRTFWPSDFPVAVLAVIAGFIAVAVVTAIMGRVFCGWACPQTVFMEMLFRKLEFLIEGDGPAQRRAAAQPLRGARLVRRLLKYAAFLAVSIVLSHVFLAYFLGDARLLQLLAEGPAAHLGLFIAVSLFTLVFFWHFAWFREQLCCFVCPYARLQSVLMDNNSLAIAYDKRRGESRATKAERNAKIPAGATRSFGDCVDCGLCQQVCPTGIDIRNGFPQLECVSCTACIDACDKIMEANGKPRGLIRYASAEGLEKGRSWHFTPRIVAYLFVLVLLGGLISHLVVSRTAADLMLLRVRGSIGIIDREAGQVKNLLEIKIQNKTNRPMLLRLRCLSHPEASFTLPDGIAIAPNETHDKIMAQLILPLRAEMRSGSITELSIGLYDGEHLVMTVPFSFLNPNGLP